jgi:hypothetical protein
MADLSQLIYGQHASIHRGNSWEENINLRNSRKEASRLWLDTDLCEECSTADVRSIILCRAKNQEHALGPLLAIKRRKHLCWLCHSVYAVCLEAMPRIMLEALLREEELLREEATPIVLSQDRYALGRALVSEFVDVPCAHLKRAIYDLEHPPEWTRAYIVLTHYRFELALHGGTGEDRIPMTKTLTNEMQSRHANYEQISGWLQICSSKHTSCKALKPTGEINHKLYLINVYSRRVQSMRQSTVYVALSYTWGDSRIQTSREYSSKPLTSSQSSYFPRYLPKNAPRTVEDAITAVKQLGLRFLWTDLYCINQTSTAERETQIQNMGQIYEGAMLTICAISSPSSTAGIDGISKPWQPIHQITTQFDSGYLQATGNPHFLNDINDSVWRTRAWTFQECKLSGRKLCFAAHGVFMWCGEEVFHHAVVNMTPTFHVALRPDDPHNPQMYAAFEPLSFYAISRTNLSDEYCDLSLYFKLVNDYCQRQLTFEEDAQDAISGLLNRMATVHDSHFIFGLPTNHLTRALMWSCGPCLERPRRPSFPSWTWLGWNADPSRTRFFGEQPKYEYWLENLSKPEAFGGSRLYKMRVFWIDPGHSTDQGMDVAISVASQAWTSAKGKPPSNTLSIKAQTADCRVRCLAHHDEPVPGFTADGEPLNGQLAEGDLWMILDNDGEPLPRDVILDTDGDQTEDYTFEISPEVSSKIDPEKSSSGKVKMVLLQRWVEINQKRGEPDETCWGDRGWFLIVSGIGEGRFERIALTNMEYEHFDAMDTKEEEFMLV